jgi:PAS domain S-box-containing protein
MARSIAWAWPVKIQTWLRPMGVAAALGLCALGIVLLAMNVWRDLVALERLSSDNTQWSLMQTEVEILRLELSIKQAIITGKDSDLTDLRRWFDVVYSRVGMLGQSQLYAPRLLLPEYVDEAQKFQAFLDRTVPLIDGPDSELRAALGNLAEMLPEVRKGARKLTLSARKDAAVASDTRRQAVKLTLMELAVLTAALLLALSGLALILLQLTRRMRAEVRKSALTSARLQTIFATSADAIIVTNRGGWIVDINPAAEAVFGHGRDQVLGIHALKVFLPPELAETQSHEITAILEASAARAKGKEAGPLRIELQAMKASGDRFPVELSLGTMQIATGGVIVALVRDISDRRMAQGALTQALERAQAGERAKAEFIAVMSHEMRTPLNGLLGSVELLRTTDLQTGQKDLIGVMASSGQILLDHVNSVLDISKVEGDRNPATMIDFDLDRLIEDCVANQAGIAVSKGLQIIVAPPDGKLGWVTGDPSRLRQILLNLIGNAVKFTAIGRITVEAERAAYSQGVEIRVIDTGIGIPEDDLDRVFDDFVTLDTRYDRRAGGTGLGLGIARRVAHAMGGDIGVESVSNDGSLFWVRLPLPTAELAIPVPATAFTGAPDSTAKTASRVLVIEDNAVNRFVLRRLLEECGHIVSEAENGMDGVAVAMAQPFDLIMTDISMPGLDGVEVTRRIRKQSGPSQKARVIAVTAHALPADLARFRAAGIDDCLTKPITRVSLSAAMTETVVWATTLHAETFLDRSHIDDLRGHIGALATADLIARVISEGDAADAEDLWSSGNAGAQRLHDLAGMAGTFGARYLQARLAELEVAHGNHEVADVDRLTASLSAIWHSTRGALDVEAQRLIAIQEVAATAG